MSKENMREIYSCKCKIIDPILLPCNNKICLHFLQNNINPNQQTIKCLLCSDEHIIPYLDNKIKAIAKTNSILNKFIIEIDEFELLNPETYVYDYFFDLRNKLDVHREVILLNESKRKNSGPNNKEVAIKAQSDDLIQNLNKIEFEWKMNLTNANQLVKNYDFSSYKDLCLKKYKHEILSKALITNNSIELLNRAEKELENHLNDLNEKIKAYKNKIQNNQIVELKLFSQENHPLGQIKITRIRKEIDYDSWEWNVESLQELVKRYEEMLEDDKENGLFEDLIKEHLFTLKDLVTCLESTIKDLESKNQYSDAVKFIRHPHILEACDFIKEMENKEPLSFKTHASIIAKSFKNLNDLLKDII